MKFAQVEREDGSKTYVNTGQVLYFEEVPAGSRIHFADGQTVMLVLHASDDLVKIIRDEPLIVREAEVCPHSPDRTYNT